MLLYKEIIMEGFVKWYSSLKGFGFIQDDNEIDYFVHSSDLNYGFVPINGTLVEFEPVKSDKGWKAVNVKAVDKPDEDD